MLQNVRKKSSAEFEKAKAFPQNPAKNKVMQTERKQSFFFPLRLVRVTLNLQSHVSFEDGVIHKRDCSSWASGSGNHTQKCKLVKWKHSGLFLRLFTFCLEGKRPCMAEKHLLLTIPLFFSYRCWEYRYSLSLQMSSRLLSALALTSHPPRHNWCWSYQSLERSSFQISLCSLKTFPPDTKASATYSVASFSSLLTAAQGPGGQAIALKINLKNSSCLQHSLNSRHHNTEGEIRGSPRGPLPKWVNNETLQELLNQALLTFPSFFLFLTASVLSFCYKYKQNQGSKIFIHWNSWGKNPRKHDS